MNAAQRHSSLLSCRSGGIQSIRSSWCLGKDIVEFVGSMRVAEMARKGALVYHPHPRVSDVVSRRKREKAGVPKIKTYTSRLLLLIKSL